MLIFAGRFLEFMSSDEAFALVVQRRGSKGIW